MKKLLLTLAGLLALSVSAQTTYVAVSTADDIEIGAQYILVANAGGEYGYWAMGASNASNPTTAAYRKAVTVTVNGGICDIANVGGVATFSLETGTEANSYALKLASGSYITFTGTSSNNLKEDAELTKGGSFFISFNEDGTASINNADKTARALKFNYNDGSTPRYANYSKTGTQQPCPFIYKLNTSGVIIASPSFNVEAGLVEAGTKVEISCATSGAEIYYTLDGTTPSKKSTKYVDAITINETTTIKAIAYVGDGESGVSVATYTVVKAMSISEVAALNNGESFIMDTPLTVVYANSADTRYNYVYADGVYALVFSNNKLGLKIGDVIKSGWSGTMTYYNGLPELVPADKVEISDETGTIPTFATVAAAEINNTLVNTPVVIKNVNFAEATPDGTVSNFTGTIDDTELAFRNTFKLGTVAAGSYDVTCIVSVYDKNKTELGTAMQLVPLVFTPTTVGIDDIEAAENAPVEYFNLQGVRVANPENGLYLRRQGNKVTKVIVK